MHRQDKLLPLGIQLWICMHVCVYVQGEKKNKLERSESMLKTVCFYYGKGLVHRETAGEIIDLIIYSLGNAKPASRCRNCSVPRTLKPKQNAVII